MSLFRSNITRIMLISDQLFSTFVGTDRQTDRQTDRHTDRQTDRHTDRQTDRQTHGQTDRHIQTDT